MISTGSSVVAEASRLGPVAVMDSGIGGLPYLDEARRLLPFVPFVYLADREGFPYGTKSREAVEAIVIDRVRRLVVSWRPRAIVIACNTASQAALAAVRTDNPDVPIIGTVPAIKPAAERTRSGVIGILATERTIRDPYLDDLVASFAAERRVLRVGAQDLVEFVERRLASSTAEERRAAVLPSVRLLVEGGADEIVLACTHFLHIAGDIADCARELLAGLGGAGAARRIEVVDSREGVARRLRQVLADEGGLGQEGAALQMSSLLLSGSEPFEADYEVYARRYCLDGPLPLDRRPPSGPGLR